MHGSGVHLLIGATGDDQALRQEVSGTGLPARLVGPGLLLLEGRLPPQTRLATVRQCLPNCHPLEAESVAKWSRALVAEVIRNIPGDAAWQLHVFPVGTDPVPAPVGARALHSARRSPAAPGTAHPVRQAEMPVFRGGERRCELIHSETLAELGQCSRLRLRKFARQGVLSPESHLVQLLLTGPDSGWISASPAPEPFTFRHLIVPFPGGRLPVPQDKQAPSRAFAKLVEAELRFGRRIQPGERCVDLGASPGGWTWVARQRGAHVVAVDRSPLREDLMNDSAVTFVRGDAFSYEPPRPVDWLICDVIAAPERSIELVLQWARQRWMRHFVVTIKLRVGDHPKLDRLKSELPAWSDDWYLTHLCANKHEACVFGTVRDSDPVTA